MGVGKPYAAEDAPAMGYIAVAADEDAEAGQALSPENQWNGGLLKFCGSCDKTGFGSCLLSYYLPCIAFG